MIQGQRGLSLDMMHFSNFRTVGCTKLEKAELKIFQLEWKICAFTETDLWLQFTIWQRQRKEIGGLGGNDWNTHLLEF